MAVIRQQGVQQFDRSMIEKALRSASLRFLRDSNGDFIVEFGYDDRLGVVLVFHFAAEGDTGQIYAISGLTDKFIPKNDWGKAVMVCNTWNKEKRWPKAYLSVSNPSTDATGVIVLEEQFDLRKGIHQELLEDFTLETMHDMHSFWEWAHQEQGL